MQYFILSILWILFCVIHSGLITTTVTKIAKNSLKNNYRFYRLFYNFIAIITFLPIIYYSEFINSYNVISWQDNLKTIQYLTIFIALLLFWSGAKQYNMAQFIGIAQIFHKEKTTTLSNSGNISNKGILGLIRHPWYTGTFLLLWAREFTIKTIIVNIILSIYLIVGTYLEERKLILEFGNEYQLYKTKVSMFIPFKWIQQKLRKKK